MQARSAGHPHLSPDLPSESSKPSACFSCAKVQVGSCSQGLGQAQAFPGTTGELYRQPYPYWAQELSKESLQAKHLHFRSKIIYISEQKSLAPNRALCREGKQENKCYGCSRACYLSTGKKQESSAKETNPSLAPLVPLYHTSLFP